MLSHGDWNPSGQAGPKLTINSLLWSPWLLCKPLAAAIRYAEYLKAGDWAVSLAQILLAQRVLQSGNTQTDHLADICLCAALSVHTSWSSSVIKLYISR